MKVCGQEYSRERKQLVKMPWGENKLDIKDFLKRFIYAFRRERTPEQACEWEDGQRERIPKQSLHRVRSLTHGPLPEPMRPRPELNPRVRRSTNRATQAPLDIKDLNLYRFKTLWNEIQTNGILKILITYLDFRLAQSDIEYSIAHFLVRDVCNKIHLVYW